MHKQLKQARKRAREAEKDAWGAYGTVLRDRFLRYLFNRREQIYCPAQKKRRCTIACLCYEDNCSIRLGHKLNKMETKESNQ